MRLRLTATAVAGVLALTVVPTLPGVSSADEGPPIPAGVTEIETDAGYTLYVEPPPPPGAIRPPSSDPVPRSLASSLADVFTLASLPGAQRTIYLDFTGHTVTNTAWNQPPNLGVGLPQGTVLPAFSIDADPTTFNDTERAVIHQVWQRVAEDYAPFAVNVTTADPGPDALHRSDSADQTFGSHAVVAGGSTTRSLFCGGCVGIAYAATGGVIKLTPAQGVSAGFLQPALTFSAPLGNDPIQIAETVSHEVGHNLGLHHDGVVGGSEYYAGHNGWSPIMGYGWGAITQFSRGEYPQASNTQDDLADIAVGGFPLRADDHPTTTPIASGVPMAGVIHDRTDTDTFSLVHDCTGPLNVAAAPAPVGPNLDIELRVERDGALIETVDPVSAAQSTQSWNPGFFVPLGMDAAWAQESAAPGVYTFRIDGVGRGSPATGYSDYASLGQYTITATSGCNTPPTGGPTDDPPDDSSDDASGPTSHDPDPDTDPETGPPAATPPALIRPGAPRIVPARSGRRGRPITAIARWRPPTSTGSHPIRAYRVTALRLGAGGRVVGRVTRLARPGVRRLQLRLRPGRYRFRVVAVSDAGRSVPSARSNVVRAR